jgi:hypothetical protein
MHLFRIPTFAMVLVVFTMLSQTAKAQGCSDAGVCTAESFDHKTPLDSVVSKPKRSIRIGASFGIADNNIGVAAGQVEFTNTFSNTFSGSLRLTGINQTGNGFTSTGFSDIYALANYKLNAKSQFTIGAKLPLSDGNKICQGRPLPMDYQSSLGTYDLIFGFSQKIGKKLYLVVATQLPLTNNNNTFIAATAVDTVLTTFSTTNKFVRAGDIIIRATYPIKINNKMVITPGLLPIYHLDEDKFTDLDGVVRPIVGSSGLTVNVNFFADYQASLHHAWQISLGAPFIVRDVRPDGLTRALVAAIEYKYSF